jgi:hypothetical protein
MTRRNRKKSLNADLVESVQNHTDQILMFCERLGDNRPVILLDYQCQKIYAYRYEEYKATLSEESQALLDEEYEKARANNKVVVLVWDEETRRLVTTTFDYD